MKQTPLPPTKGQTTPVKSVGNDQQASYEARAQFFSAALNMSWQLAIVVLVPIIGGFELDKRLDMLPLLTIVGFLLAMIGMAVVVWRQMQLNSPGIPPKGHHS
ncbi:MAG: hypothetical protein JWO35_710 [Candidatus Saccharibacteria bacterium]|nr:hypothetical protein [Candidatus Saccharibacteria bacterium]